MSTLMLHNTPPCDPRILLSNVELTGVWLGCWILMARTNGLEIATERL